MTIKFVFPLVVGFFLQCISYSLEIAAPRYPCSADAFHSPRRDDSDCDVPQISMRDTGAGSRMQDFVAQLLVLNTFRTFSSVVSFNADLPHAT